MTHAEDVDLAALALGESDEVAPEVAAHVASCAACAAEVRALEATLAVARRTPDAPLEAPPASVWAGIEAALPPAPVVPLAAPPTPARERRRPTVPAWVAAAAVVAALALGAVLGRALGTGSEPPAATPDTVVARASLDTLDGSAARGAAVMVRHDGQMVLRVRTSGLGAADGALHEVWLINRDGKRLVSIGLLSAGGRGAFVVPERLISEGYVTVDVSTEPDDGVPAHSGDSVARGELGLRSGA